MPNPKQHHYVAKAYLDGFLPPNATQLVCYGRRGISFRKSPDELGKRRKYYSIRNDDGSWDDTQEELIERTIEKPGLPVIKKLSSGNTRLTWEERRALSLYIAFQEYRTPAAREHSRAMSRLLNDRILHDVLTADPSQTSVGLVGRDGQSTQVSLEEIVQAHNVLCDDHARQIHTSQVESAFLVQPMYEQMKWTVFYATGEAQFITTDTPVIRVFYGTKSGGTGLNRTDVEVRFPVSASAFMTITHDVPRAHALMKATDRKRSKVLDKLPEVRMRHLTDAKVRFFNRGQVRHAHYWVFSGSECPWIQDLLNEPYAGPSMIDMSSHDLMHFRSDANYDPAIDFC